MQDAALHPACGGPLAERPVVLIADAECLHHTIVEVAGVVLPWMGAPDIDRPDIQRSAAARDPVRHHEADAAAGEDAEGIEAGGDEEALQVGCLAHEIVVVGRERLGAAEEEFDAGLREYRDAAAGALEIRLHPIPVRRYFAEGEIAR